MSYLFYCNKCLKYTLEKKCSKCNIQTIIKNPPRYSPQDHYGRYRRELKKSQKG